MQAEQSNKGQEVNVSSHNIEHIKFDPFSHFSVNSLKVQVMHNDGRTRSASDEHHLNQEERTQQLCVHLGGAHQLLFSSLCGSSIHQDNSCLLELYRHRTE